MKHFSLRSKSPRTLMACLGMIIALPAAAQPNSADIDLTFAKASTRPFIARRGTVATADGNLIFTFKKGGVLNFPSLVGSRHMFCNPRLERRNTLCCIMENRSSATALRVRFVTAGDSVYNDAKSKIFILKPNAPKRAYYFNLSDVASARGRLTGLRFEMLNGRGTLLIDRITFEQERPLRTIGGTVGSCKADRTTATITVTGTVRPECLASYPEIALYETSMQQEGDRLDSMKCLYRGKASASYRIEGIPLTADDGVSRLSSQFLAVVQNAKGESMPLSERFYIENWSDFETNPYAFELPQREVDVTSCGARGDGFTDDTHAIQRAIDSLAELGGGRVTLPGDTSFYGRRYVATHLDLRSNIELHIGRGAILWQSQNPNEYPYKPSYGHEGVIPGINWTHNMHVSNLPLIQGKSVNNIKITGDGQIRMMDPESQDPRYAVIDYQRYCTDRIHLIPLGLWNCKGIEVSNLDIVRSNNYHTAFYACENVFIGNLKMHEVQCVSGDGMGLGVGTHNVKIVRTFLETNDDGVVLWAGYNDPRGLLWWWARPDADNSIRNVVVCHSYISSARPTPDHNGGGGKAIAFIPWGTDSPSPDRIEIDGITVFDCVLKGGYAVGTWPDNPYFGKQPFDNTESDDYSSVKNVRIYANRYLSPCSIAPIVATNFISDCGIHSSDSIMNGSFGRGLTNWTVEGNIGIENGAARLHGGNLYEGLYLTAGRYTLTLNVEGRCTAFVEAAPLLTGELPAVRIRHEVNAPKPQTLDFTIDIPKEGTYFVGIRGADAQLHEAKIVRQ